MSKKKNSLAKDINKSFGKGLKIWETIIKSYAKLSGLMNGLSSFIDSKITNQNWKIFSRGLVIVVTIIIGSYLFIPIIAYALIKNIFS